MAGTVTAPAAGGEVRWSEDGQEREAEGDGLEEGQQDPPSASAVTWVWEARQKGTAKRGKGRSERQVQGRVWTGFLGASQAQGLNGVAVTSLTPDTWQVLSVLSLAALVSGTTNLQGKLGSGVLADVAGRPLGDAHHPQCPHRGSVPTVVTHTRSCLLCSQDLGRRCATTHDKAPRPSGRSHRRSCLTVLETGRPGSGVRGQLLLRPPWQWVDGQLLPGPPVVIPLGA